MTTEDHWTPPHPWCPHPEWWHASPVDADSSEWEVASLVGAMVRALQPEIVIETGTASGAGAWAIGDALVSNKHGHLYTCEIDPGMAASARRRLKGLPVTVECVDSHSWDPPEPIDFAWIDSHDARHRVGEILLWRNLFRPGAIIGVHDTAPNMGREVLHDLLRGEAHMLGWPLLNLRTPRGVSFLQVPGW